MSPSADPSSRRAPNPLWWRLYFALAAFDLVTISFSLYLNHRLIGLHDDSVAVNQEWAARLSGFSDLAQLAGAVNAPGNDVFDSRDVAAESARTATALAEFNRALAAAETDLLTNAPPAAAASLRADLRQVGEAIGAMVEEANLIFGFFRANQADKAGERMATMDRKFAQLNAGFAALGHHVRTIQAENFRAQQAASAVVRRYEFFIAAAIVLIVLAVTVYGHRMARTMGAVVDERERYLAELRDAQTGLERRVAERTAELREEILRRERAQTEAQETHAQLLIASRQAGMAEVATGVLHNVGNVLNSVNVSAAVVVEQLRTSKTASLTRAVQLLGDHRGDLAAFLADDPQGKKLPEFFVAVAAQLAREQALLAREARELQANIEHIKQIVAMQQSYAKVSGAQEKLAVADLVEDALRISLGGLTRHRVEVVREFAPVPPVLVDRHKVLQILINLVNNAKHALEERPDDRRLTLRIAAGPAGHVRLEIADNGVGIPAENLNRIFNHGFTTKASGHGFGLHSGANAAREMGGSLHVRSDGPGCGATFVLHLPPEPAAVATAPAEPERRAA
ncbi:MAG: hypothetical protein RLZZ15_3670 [Verrucomicrobiota bacterium]